MSLYFAPKPREVPQLKKTDVCFLRWSASELYLWHDPQALGHAISWAEGMLKEQKEEGMWCYRE